VLFYFEVKTTCIFMRGSGIFQDTDNLTFWQNLRVVQSKQQSLTN
jgi:hypothetical protein